MKRILLSLMIIALASSVAIGATRAYFSDTETSIDNTFTAGSLDLNIDGGDTNVVKFTVNNMRPGNQPTGSWILSNVGSLDGYLDLENITVTNNENGRLEPEIEAGDTTPNIGELQDVVNFRLYIDVDKAGGYSAGDIMIYNGVTGNVAGSYDQNYLIAAGSDIRLVALFDWWPNSAPYNGTAYHFDNDNKAMGDDMTLDITYSLSQNQ